MKFIEIVDLKNVTHLLNVDCIMCITTYDDRYSISMCYKISPPRTNMIDVSLELGEQLISSLKLLND